LIKIYVARHGETTWNAEGKIQGRSDPDLSPKGYAQSLILLEKVKDKPLSAIYTSTLKRSILTAQPIAQHLGLAVQIRTELDEIAFGIFEGVKFSEVDGSLRMEWEQFKENRLTYHIPGAENYTDVANRVRPFKEKILRDHQNQEILIVAHRGVNRMLLGLLLEFSLEEALKIEQTNECLYLIERNGESRARYYMDGEAREGLLLVGQNAIL
jgi:broad specificity phosphatase PhoE